ncbi:MAG: class III poly(R)-hydroxyalkanoic acid synthase subunit PhaC [Silicimonas sp.]|nr:class III poly(R)-hydroxyalkanoic acid synthase subunit PhaC [Silicimonas sp.]NND17681.1 class III poly(R)-hydroxyalkanoic acid synthase subunit PhaC [Silicimonas sp.]NNL71742.1 class III poly(R)-hydroxyalkanoic acid synthase subunit PhaC [Silicimonas sp.]
MAEETDLANIAAKEAGEFYSKFMRSAEALSKVKEADVDVGATPKTRLMAQDKVTLHRYNPLDGVEVKTGPVLIVYGLIGRYTMADLQEDRSLVRNLLARGVDLYLVDWGHPSRADQHITLDDYVDWYLDDCVDRICKEADVDAVTLLGICEGGVFSTLYAAQHPEKIKNLILTITPIDFHGDQEDADETHGFINLWTRNLEDEDIRRLVKAFGNLPGEIMASVFQMMTPVRTMTKYNLDLLEATADDKKLLNFLRMEKWLADRPHHPGAAALQWLIELYKENRLIKGTFEMSGKRIDLENVKMPVLNVYALQDHIIPPPCSKALEKYVGTSDYSEIALRGGHVGVYVSGKSQGIVADGVFNWLMERQ